jgi:hypothetical protein
MRLVTWNCNKGAYDRKIARVDTLGADVAVIQECASPAAESNQCLWFGDAVRQGILVTARAPYRLARMPEFDGTPKFVIPVSVSGPASFALFVVNLPPRQMRGLVSKTTLFDIGSADGVTLSSSDPGEPRAVAAPVPDTSKYASLFDDGPRTRGPARLARDGGTEAFGGNSA